MGCTQSKFENEESVLRCRDRKQYMKDSVAARNHFAAAHSAYTMALKNTGAALSDYAQGEVNELNPPSSSSSSQHPTLSQEPPPPPPPPNDLPPPPPPLPNFSPSPLKRATSMPEFAIPKPDPVPKPADPILEDDEEEEEDEDEEEDENVANDHQLRHRGANHGARGGANGGVPATPPSPPQTPPIPPPPPESTWDYFFSGVDNMGGPGLGENEEIRPAHGEENGYQHNGNGGYNRANGKGPVSEEEVEPKTPEKVVVEPELVVKPKQVKKVVHSNSAPMEEVAVRRGGGSGGGGGGKVVKKVNLLQILNDVDDHFLKASEGAHEVSKMLEATRLHYHSNFADNRGHIDHSARVMRVITWNRSFRGMPNGDDGKDDFDAEEHETHATVLDKLLAWEKKLYDEVKAGEHMKVEYQRKVALLNKQKKRGASTESLEKTKAAVSHLHTRYIVDMQSMDSTVAEINHLRDDQLYPKLVALVDGMVKMWETMHVHHNHQLNIVMDLRSLDVSQGPKETSKQHQDRTDQLHRIVQEWHAQFQNLVTHQKEYVQALNSWLKLNLIPIESSLKEKVSSPPRVHQPPIQPLLHAWHEHLEKLAVDLAGTQIFSFAGVIKNIELHQEEEMRLKDRSEETRKEFMRKSRQYEDWYHKYMEKKVPDEMDPDRTEDTNPKDPLAERQFQIESLKKRLEEEVEAHQKHCTQVREKSLLSLKTHLPELFRAMSDFSFACSEMYKRLQAISQPRNPSGTS